MRSKYLMLVLLIALFTTSGVSATNDISEVVGPYKISFSLPDDVNATVDTEMINGESYYGTNYTVYSLILEDSLNSIHPALVEVLQYEVEGGNLIDIANLDADRMKGVGYPTVSSYDREIDGRPGILLVGNSPLEHPDLHTFVYLFDNRTAVSALSVLPWNDGSSLMLRTLHIEKVE